MSLFSRLFGGSAKSEPEAPKGEDYKGFSIFPAPVKEGQQHRIAARIEKEVDGELKVHNLVRADTIADYDTCVQATLGKARQVIDEQGERIFG